MQSASETRVLCLHPTKLTASLKPAYPLSGPTITIGRHPSNRINLPIESVSRFHARIERQGEQVMLTDLRSSNGTYVNGERVDAAMIEPGQKITFGNVEFFCELADQQAVTMDPSPLETPVQLVGTDRKQSRPIMQAQAGKREARPFEKMSEIITESEELARAYRKLASLYKLSDLLRSAPEEQQLLECFMDLIFEVLPADRGVVLLRDDPEGDLLIRVTRSREIQQDKPISLSRTIIDRCMEDRVAILSQDAMSDQRFQSSESVLLHDIRSTIVAPLIANNDILGALHLDTRESVHAFNDDDLQFVTALADDLALYLSSRRILDENQRNLEMAAIGEVITDLAHNIKNMLLLSEGGIKLMDRLMSDGDMERIQQNWVLTQKTLARISTMVKEILEYSRAPQIRRTEAGVNQIVHETCQSFKHEFENKGIMVRVRLDKRIENSMLDTSGLERCLVNLLVNACEAIKRPDGEIVVTTFLRTNKDIVLTVEDNGEGIPPSDVARIFYPRFSTKGEQGTGLGMALVKKWVTAIGGTIRVYSTVGEGTRFAITVPRESPCTIAVESEPSSDGART